MTTRPLRPDDELLSAYFDGEVTPEERARAEVLRHTSPAAAAELESYAELSQLLKSLPRDAAPPEVHAAAMQVAERTSLLRTPSTRPSRRWRFVREAVIFFAGCAAAIVISFAVQTSHPDAQAWNRRGVMFTAQPRTSMPAAEQPVASAEPVFAIRSNDFFDVSGGASPPVSSDGVTFEESRASPGTAAMTLLSGMSTSDARNLESAQAAATNARRLAELGMPSDPGQKAAVPVGDVVLNLFAATTVNENYVPNVDVFVKDPEAGANQFQQILVSNGIMVSNPAEDSTEKKDRSNGRTAAEGVEVEAQRPAVYLEAPIEPVTRSLEQLAQQPEMFGVRLRPPLELPLEEELTEAAGLYRTRRFDVERLKLEYNRNLELVRSGEVAADPEAAVSALDALHDVKHPLSGEATVQRDAYRRIAAPKFQNSRNAALRIPQPEPAASSSPVNPLALQQQPELGNSQVRFSVPTPNWEGRTRLAKDLSTAAAASPAKPGLGEEMELRQRLRNYYGVAGNVRLLVVFQEAASAAPSQATTVPAAPPAARPAPAEPNQR